jgi:hypothetical protein
MGRSPTIGGSPRWRPWSLTRRERGARIVAGGSRIGNRGYFYPLTMLAMFPTRHRRCARNHPAPPPEPALADPAGLGERFEPRRDVDAVAEQILALHNDVADMHADAKPHLFTRGSRSVVLGERLLNRDCALDRIDGTGEIGDDAVAGVAKDPPAIGRDVLVENGAAGGQPEQGADLVLLHQPAVACDIGRENRCDLADRFFFLAHRTDKTDPFAIRCAKEAYSRRSKT